MIAAHRTPGVEIGRGDMPFCSVIRNEAEFIARCLDSIAATTYPVQRLEVLIVDGQSHDGTRAIVEDYCHRFAFMRPLDNPRYVSPVALVSRQREGRS